jgi:hypothetical protein
VRSALQIAAVAALVFMGALDGLAQVAPKPAAMPRALPTEAEVRRGDFDAMVERRVVRVVVPYSRTLYYNDKGRERGITAGNLTATDERRKFVDFVALNATLKGAGKPGANLVVVPDALEDEDMMEMLNAGLFEAIVVTTGKAGSGPRCCQSSG